MDPGTEFLGEVVRVQIQPERVKVAERYDPAVLVSVDALSVSHEGASSGGFVDVHHSRHERGPRWSPFRVVSVGFTSHYDIMRSHFGLVPDGVAAENILIASDRLWTETELRSGFRIGEVAFRHVAVAEPCVPFTRYLCGRPSATPEELAPDLELLRDGVRGFVCAPDGDGPFTIQVGDLAYVAAAS